MNRGNIWKIILILLAIILPILTPGQYFIYVATLAVVYIAASFGLDVLVGYTNLISLGSAAFFGIGAYSTAIFSSHGVPLLLALLLGTLISIIIGIIIGLPSIRLGDVYLAIATLGFVLVFNQLSKSFGGITGGASGMVVPTAKIGPLVLNGRGMYVLITLIICILLFTGYNFVTSKYGRALRAIKDSEIGARAVGIDTSRQKLMAFAISASGIGLSGGLYAILVGFIDPSMFDIFISVIFLSMVVIGGVGSIKGAIMGALFVTIVPQVFTYIGLSDIQSSVYGVAMIITLFLFPHGLSGLFEMGQRPKIRS